MLPSPALDKSALYEHIKAKTEGMPERKYVVMKNGYKFRDVHEVYRMEDDVWERTLNLRSLDEAVTGDVNMSMPPPVVFPVQSTRRNPNLCTYSTLARRNLLVQHADCSKRAENEPKLPCLWRLAELACRSL